MSVPMVIVRRYHRTIVDQAVGKPGDEVNKSLLQFIAEVNKILKCIAFLKLIMHCIAT